MLLLLAGGPPGSPASPGPAFASQYQLTSDCIGGAPGELFIASNTDAASFTTTQTCPTSGGQGSGLHVGEVKGSVNPFIADGGHAEFTFTTVPGTTITGISYRRFLGQTGDRNTIPALRDHVGAIVGGETCQYPVGDPDESCDRGDPSIAVAPTTINGLDTTSLSFGLRCVAQPPSISCLSSPPQYEQAWFSVYSAVITINETTAPTLGTTSGTLVAGGWLQGTRTLALSSATDPSGIQDASLSVDGGAPREASSGGALACTFTRPKPCEDLVDTSWSIDTTTLPDGNHAAVITARNAAQVSASSGSISFKTDNIVPEAPRGLSSTAGSSWQGSSSSTELTWSLPDQGSGSPVAAAYTAICDRNGLNCSAATPAATLTSADVGVSTPGAYTLKVWLEDAAGAGPAASIPFRYSTAPPPAPSGVSSSASAWQSSRHISVTWTPPPRSPNEPPIASGRVAVCNVDGSACDAPQGVGAAGGVVELPREGAFLLRAWSVDAAGNGDPAHSASTDARYSATPPTVTVLSRDPLGVTASRHFAATFSSRSGGPAPIASTRWRLCRRSRCPLAGETKGTAVRGRAPRLGTWMLLLTPIDAAGVRGGEARIRFVYRRPPRIRARVSITPETVAARFFADRRFTGSLAVRLRLIVDYRRRFVDRKVRVRRGVGRLGLRLVEPIEGGVLIATFPGSRIFQRARLVVRLRR